MPLLTTAEVAEMTGLSESTLRYFRHTGRGPKSAKFGRVVRYRREEVEAWIEYQFETTGRGDETPAA